MITEWRKGSLRMPWMVGDEMLACLAKEPSLKCSGLGAWRNFKAHATNSSLYQVRPLGVNLPGNLIMLFEKCQHFPVKEEKDDCWQENKGQPHKAALSSQAQKLSDLKRSYLDSLNSCAQLVLAAKPQKSQLRGGQRWGLLLVLSSREGGIHPTMCSWEEAVGRA